jgi:signal transduction histidine kinase
LPRQQLRDAVGAMAALQPLQHELAAADSESQLLGAARESARILFGAGDVVFLLRTEDGAALAALPLPGQAPQLQRLQVGLQTPVHGACGRAAISGRTCSTFEGGSALRPAVGDLQLARALGTEGLLCVPMANGRAVLGVMACAVTRRQAERLEQRRALLGSFGALLAAQLQTWRTLSERNREGSKAATADRLLERERQVLHEVSNPLGIIKNYLTVVRRKLPDGAQLGEELQVLQEEIDRVGSIMRQLGQSTPTSTAASGGRDPAALDLNAAVQSLHTLYGEPLFGRAGIELVLDLQKPLAPARADRDSLRQLLLNLWKNAAEALPPGARVTTSTADHVHRDGRVYAVLCVADNGPGLPDDVLASLFKPLGAARRPGRSGLGLSIAASLVSRLGGHITCQSLPGRGTRFDIYFPQGAHGTVPEAHPVNPR